MDALESVWEQELYNEIEYKRKDSLFHCFEGDTAFVGISFMDELEANHFNEKIQERINKRRSREVAAQSSESGAIVDNEGKKVRKHKSNKKEKQEKSEGKASVSTWKIWKKKEKKEKKKKFDKSMIGGPVENSFAHVDGVKTGLSDGGMGLRFGNKNDIVLDEGIKILLTNAGMHDVLANPEKAMAFHNWASKGTFYEDVEKAKMKGSSASKVPPPPATSGGAPPPPPPPPPPVPSAPSLKPSPSSKPPPLPTTPKNKNAGPNPVSLLDQIQAGHTLKPADERGIGGNDFRGRSGSFQRDEEPDLTDVLTKALEEFKDAAGMNSDSSSDSESDSDEWD